MFNEIENRTILLKNQLEIEKSKEIVKDKKKNNSLLTNSSNELNNITITGDGVNVTASGGSNIEIVGNNFKGTLVVQSVRPVYGSQYESPILNINDTNFSFEYIENQNMIFNERQFSGKNLIDVLSFYVYLILGYDADTFQMKGGTPWFDKAMKITQNSQNQNYAGWSQIESPRNSVVSQLPRIVSALSLYIAFS
jgi:hypothetical protein